MNIALIPARKGSKRLKNKNIKHIGGKPLIQHTIESVKKCNIFDRIIVSTDDQKIKEIVKNNVNIELHNRQAKDASSKSKTSELLYKILHEYNIKEGICGLFLPTSPFRSEEHIIEAFKVFNETIKSVISVCFYDYPIQFSFKLKEKMENLFLEFPKDSPLLKNISQVQTQTKFVHPNGAIYLSKVEEFKQKKTFFSPDTGAYLMDKIHSIDIDEMEDLIIARALYDTKSI